MEIVRLKSKDEILRFLNRYDASTPRKISDRVSSLEAYSEKLYKFAENYVIYFQKEPAGFFSFYDNDTREKKAYLTLIAIDTQFQKMQLGSYAMQFICRECRKKGMSKICLEVDKNNNAYYFYEKKGFHIVGMASEYSVYMEKEIYMFYWEKKGLIFNPTECEQRPYWRWNFAQGENTLLYDDFIRVYFCCREKPNETGQTISRVSYVDLSRENPSNIVRLADKPVLEPGGLGEFDEFGTYPFSVIRNEGKIYGYYGGVTRCESVPFNTSIGCAVSDDDGETFKKIGRGPVLTHSLYEPFMVCSPKVRIYDGKWYMFYSAGVQWTTGAERPEICYKLCMATSTDGIHWEKCNRHIMEDKIGELESQACGDVILKNGRYHMFFCYRGHVDFRKNVQNSYRIGYASSTDLIHWTREDEKAGIDVSDNQQDWDSEMVAYPHVFECDGKVYMLYLGNEVGKYGFGLAQLKGNL